MPATKNIKQKSVVSTVQASRLKPPPRKLKELIDLVNCLPTHWLKQTILHPESLKARAMAEIELEGANPRNLDIWLSALIAEDIRDLPAKLQDYVLRGKDRSRSNKLLLSDGGVTGRYENLWDAHMKLRAVARLAQSTTGNIADSAGALNYADEVHVAKPTALNRGIRSVQFRAPLPLPVLIELDDQGLVRISKDLFSEAIEDADVEGRRIRECPVCNRIFWAGRINQPSCSTACSHALRNRRYRARYRDGYYQGARLTPKERKSSKTGKRTSKKIR